MPDLAPALSVKLMNPGPATSAFSRNSPEIRAASAAASVRGLVFSDFASCSATFEE